MNETVTETFPPYATAIIAFLATSVSTATLGGNIVVLVAFFVESSLRIPSNYFIASLAVTDVLIGLFSMNLFITYQLLGYWPLGQLLCDIWLSLDFSACLTSQYTVFLITLDRYCSVKIPVSYRNWRTLVKVRWMICVSWLFPAGLFTPVILGWKQMTSEPPRAEGKCDVSFTYYPIFNTTLILGYFWTTLVVMCSLYVGIYRVAQRLQRKSQSAGQKLAALFTIADHDLEDEEEDEDDHAREEENLNQKENNSNYLKLPDINKQGSGIGNDSGFRDTPTGIDDPLSETDCSVVTRHTCGNDPLLDDVIRSDGETQAIYSPLKTCEEQYNLSSVRSPQEDLTGLAYNHYPFNQSDETDATVEEKEADLKPPSLTPQNGFVQGVTLSPIASPQAANEMKFVCNPHKDSKHPLVHTSKPFFCECDQLTAGEFPSDSQYGNSDTDSPQTTSLLSLVPVHLFVPSPTVPITGVQTNMFKTTTEAPSRAPLVKPLTADSPVWVENRIAKTSPTKSLYYCPECYQVIESRYVASQRLRSSQSLYGCYDSPISPSKTVNYSDLSSSGQNESSDRTNGQTAECFCSYHTQLAQSEAILFTSESSEMNSYSDTPIPWYKRALCPWSQAELYENNKTHCDCPCTGRSRSFDSTESAQASSGRNVISRTVRELIQTVRSCCCSACNKCKTCTQPLKFRESTHSSKRLSHQDLDSMETRTKSSVMVNKKRLMSMAKPAVRNSFAQIVNFRNLESHNRRHARKALRTISFILGAFIICWTPYHIIMMIKGFCDDLNSQTSCVSTHLYNLSYWLCYMNSPINPFCYALSNASFRRTFFRILRGDFQRK